MDKTQGETRSTRRGGMLIGQLARATGRSIHTIRWYESQRLIPGVRRDTQHRRTYGPGHVDWLALLERLRSSGMSIREIREYTAMVRRGDSTLAERRDLMKAHRKRIEAMIHDLEESLALIDTKIEFYSEWVETGARPHRTPASRRTNGRG